MSQNSKSCTVAGVDQGAAWASKIMKAMSAKLGAWALLPRHRELLHLCSLQGVPENHGRKGSFRAVSVAGHWCMRVC